MREAPIQTAAVTRGYRVRGYVLVLPRAEGTDDVLASEIFSDWEDAEACRLWVLGQPARLQALSDAPLHQTNDDWIEWRSTHPRWRELIVDEEGIG